MAAVSRRTDPTPPNRPSISPLSTTKSSPVLERDDVVPAEEEASPLRQKSVAEIGDDLADDRSSSLSEPEDDEDEEEEARQLLEMKFADERLTNNTHEVDSEAETERLDQTPSKARKHADSTGRTPSKLSYAATADDLSEPPSPLPAGPDGDSSTSNGLHIGKKRKRSNTGDSSLTSAESDLGESPRKRSHGSPGEGEIGSRAASESINGDDADADAATTTSSRGGFKGRRGKLKGRSRKEAIKETDVEEQVTTENDEEDGEDERSAEALKHKGAASSLFEDIAKQFASFHDKLYTEKLAALSTDLEMLTQPDCRHPEYLRQMACVDARYAKQVGEVHAFYRYKIHTLRTTTLAERSQLHSQYFQSVREQREQIAYQLGEDWYKIQKERRQTSHPHDGQYILKFPTKRSEQIRNQAKYNQEVSVLSGIAKYVGFPAAPAISGAEGDALEDDLKLMKISRRVASTTTNPSSHTTNPVIPSVYNPPRYIEAPSERIAHDQYLEQNAWARPQGIIPNHRTPNLTHTPDWAEAGAGLQNAAKHNARNAGVDPFIHTHAVPSRMGVEANGGGHGYADSSEPASSATAVAARKGDARDIERERDRDRDREPISPLAVTKHRHQNIARDRDRERERELTGFRNISSTSTIDAPPDSAEKAERAERAIGAGAIPRAGMGIGLNMGLGSSPDAPRQVSSISGSGTGPTHSPPVSRFLGGLGVSGMEGYSPTTSFRPRDAGPGASAAAAPAGAARVGRK